MRHISLKQQAIELRRLGRTYGEIRDIMQVPIPKSTLSSWCCGLELKELESARLAARMLEGGEKGRLIARAMLKLKRQNYLALVSKRVSHLPDLLNKQDVAKVALGMLYLGEGSKGLKRSSVCFGNSDPDIIRLFLHFLRSCYALDEKKFRCTLQCRADQNIAELERFWLQVTKIPKNQFYSSRTDSRTIGKISRKPEYKGVCKIDYFSSDLYQELMSIGRVICMGR